MKETPEQYATRKHEGQTRKYTGEPYITHPRWVRDLVSSVNHSQAMLDAAILHDVVEDTDAPIEEVFALFGPEVEQLVKELTYTSKDTGLNRKARKLIDIAQTAAASADAQTIKLADTIHNVPSIVENDPQFARLYVSEKWELMDVMRKGDPVLYKQAVEILQWADAKLDTPEGR